MNCECKLAGWCERHKMLKSDRMVELCQTSEKYFNHWENNPGNQQSPQEIEPKPLGPGTILEKKIKAFGYRHTEGCGCAGMVQKMNRWGVVKCREKIGEIIEHLEQAAIKTGWLERMAVTVPIVKNFARKAIRDLIDEAINEAEALGNESARRCEQTA